MNIIIVWFKCLHDDVIKWKHFPRYWLFVWGIHRSPVNSPHKGQWRGALMFSLICVGINGSVNNREARDLRRYCTHYDVTVMQLLIHKTLPCRDVTPMGLRLSCTNQSTCGITGNSFKMKQCMKFPFIRYSHYCTHIVYPPRWYFHSIFPKFGVASKSWANYKWYIDSYWRYTSITWDLLRTCCHRRRTLHVNWCNGWP